MPNEASQISFVRTPDSTLIIQASHEWYLDESMPSGSLVSREIAAGGVRRVAFDTSGLTSWDSSLITFLVAVADLCRASRIELDPSALPPGAKKLLALTEAVPERGGGHGERRELGIFARIGVAAITLAESVKEDLKFIGGLTIAVVRAFRGEARFRGIDLLMTVRTCGPDALPIVTLISFLLGVIVAFMGAVQLQKFGAAIYVANLVGVGVVREMGAMMTGVIMAGRTGAAFAAQIGTMKVNQEVDALETLGVSPLEFLALPRILGLVLMMPLLCIYADVMGIVGGAAIGSGMLGLSAHVYLKQTESAVRLADVFGGLFKSAIYGILVAVAGCVRGLQCGTSASAVGDAATSAVVTGITSIVVACGLLAVIFNALGI
jgi:phospholipid/cholesterol/gamma-HCH transport system permease protein